MQHGAKELLYVIEPIAQLCESRIMAEVSQGVVCGNTQCGIVVHGYATALSIIGL